MKAFVAHAFGPIEELSYEALPDPQPEGDCVVVEAEAIGVNFPDGLLVQGLYQLRPTTPFTPGMEVAGRVLSVGPAVKSLKPGDRVACLMTFGAYAEKILVPETSATRISADMDAGHACALICAYGTAHHALRQRANLIPGETLCVVGAAGATGLAAIQIGKAMGAQVIAVASNEHKREIARQAGADVTLGYEDLRNTLKDATAGRGVDVAFDPVGGDSFDGLARSMAWNGRLLVIGFASGTIPKLPVNLALVKGFSLVGVFWGSFTDRQPDVYRANMQELMGWYATGQVRPLIEGVYPLSEAASVLTRVLTRGATGKIILRP